jgi:hypothetical protein
MEQEKSMSMEFLTYTHGMMLLWFWRTRHALSPWSN